MQNLPESFDYPAPQMVDARPDGNKTSPCILVVEDEVLIRMIVSETLADAGFRVSEASNAKAALQALSTDEFRAVVLDVGLPDANGEDLIGQIRAIRPGMPIIVTTGYDTSALRQKSAADLHLRILTKPYLPDALNAILAEWGIAV